MRIIKWGECVFLFLSFLSLVFSGASCVRAAWPLSATKTEKSALPPRPRRRLVLKKRQKKKLSSSPKRMSECPNNNKARGHPPLLVFFSHKEKTPKRQKKSLLVHFIINNETLVWSEKDGGSAFAGGNDGQGDKLSAVFSLYSLSLRGGGVSRVSFVLLESQSHF